MTHLLTHLLTHPSRRGSVSGAWEQSQAAQRPQECRKRQQAPEQLRALLPGVCSYPLCLFRHPGAAARDLEQG
jgi:hypothetical protein